MTPYRERMNAGHYGKPIATTTSQDLAQAPKTVKPKAKSSGKDTKK